MVKNSIKKHSVSISGHHTSITLETLFWDELRSLAATEKKSISDVIRDIDTKRGDQNLSSAIRVHVLQRYIAEVQALTKTDEI